MNSEDGTGTDLGRRFAMQTVEDRLRELSANILRTMRGAGRPHEILPQAQALVDAALSYREQFGQLPASEAFGDALSIGTPDDKLNQMGDERELVVTAREVIVSGALQVAASRLLGQRAQEAAGYTEMLDGAREMEHLREERRQRSAAMARGPVPPKRRR